MGYFDKLKKNGVSLRVIHGCMIVLLVLVSSVLIYATFHVYGTYQDLNEATSSYISLQKDAYTLQSASDFLTENVQRFTLAGAMEYCNAYMDEAFNGRRREMALEDMDSHAVDQDAMDKLRQAMDESLDLMNREYYAMKLVFTAMGYEDCPEVLGDVELKRSDRVLSNANKMTVARNLVLGKTYFQQKERIRSDVQACMALLESTAQVTQERASRKLGREMAVARLIIIVEALCVLLMIVLTTVLGIHPVLKAVDHINEDTRLAEIGANEFRYLARTYNRMYDVYKKSVENLNYKASHDELTGLYNRAGYDLLLTGIELESTMMLVLDVDNFKEVNDAFGHEMGDHALKRVADTVRRYFRSEDYVCRIGGDEFVVLMVHTETSLNQMVVNKIDGINAELGKSIDGLPTLSISAGAAHGSQAANPVQLFTMADRALYETKRHGRHGCTFYES